MSYSSLGRTRSVMDPLPKPLTQSLSLLPQQTLLTQHLQAMSLQTQLSAAVLFHGTSFSSSVIVQHLLRMQCHCSAIYTVWRSDLRISALMTREGRFGSNLPYSSLISFLFKINFKLTNNSLSKLLKIKRK